MRSLKKMNDHHKTLRPPVEDVKKFWEENPLCAAAIDAYPGTPQFFKKYDKLREINEPLEFARYLHEYHRFSGKRVLEVGCGNAYTLAKYAEQGASVFGLDITEAAINISKKRFELQGFTGEFNVGNAENLPYESNFFDCICSMGVLHHVPNTIKALDEIHRCLKPGGKVIVMFYHKNSFQYQVIIRLKSFIWQRSMQQVLNEVDGFGNPKGDVYSMKELKGILSLYSNLEMFAGVFSIPKTKIFIPSSKDSFIGKKVWLVSIRKRNQKYAVNKIKPFYLFT
jgi:ubiquinone/menaquinone biosynthesis C-methylase UbiE